MTVTEATAAQALAWLRATLGGLRDATPAAWAAALNAATLTTTDERGHRQPVRDAHGRPVPLHPRDEEVMPAAVSMATLGAQWPQVADLIAAVQDLRTGDRAARRARIDADVARHGPLLPDGLGADVAAELAWRAAATAAVGAGATRDQAVAHAWRTVGRTPPPPTIEPPGPRGAERARAVLAALTRAVRTP